MDGKMRARTVRYAETYEKQARAIEHNVRRFDEVIRGVEWAIATRAEFFSSIPGTNLRWASTTEIGDVPSLKLLFTIDDENYCTVVWIEEIIPEEMGEIDDPIPF